MSRARDLADSADKDIVGTLTVDGLSVDGDVGIGTSSPSTLLHLDASSDGRVARFGSGTSDTGGMYVTHNSGSTRSFELSADNILILDADRSNGRGSSRLQFNVDGTERMRIDSGGNLGIGTVSPSERLTVNSAVGIRGSNFSNLSFFGSSVNPTGVYTGLDSGGGYVVNVRDAGYQGFSTNNTERMRIDSSGNLLVGKTSTTFGSVGARLSSTDNHFTTNGGAVADFNRLTSDGSIVNFYKDGTTVGTISTRAGGVLKIGSSAYSGLDFGTSMNPMYGNAIQDNTVDLGYSTGRFRNLYLSGKTYLNTTSGAQLILQTDATRGFVGTSTSHSLIFETAATERMRIDSSGNVGIGTSSPTSNLHVEGGAGANIAIKSSAGRHWRIGDGVGSSNGNFVVYDYTGSAARLRIDSSGDVHISGTVNAANISTKAWVNFNGTGTAAARASFNLSSLTDNGTGDFTINFSNSLTDSSYAATFGGNQDITNYNKYIVGPYGTAPSSSAFRIRSQDSGGSARDFEYTFVSFFR